jgi:hypothetical protein
MPRTEAAQGFGRGAHDMSALRRGACAHDTRRPVPADRPPITHNWFSCCIYSPFTK